MSEYTVPAPERFVSISGIRVTEFGQPTGSRYYVLADPNASADGVKWIRQDHVRAIKEYVHCKLQGKAEEELFELVNERVGQAMDVPEMNKFWQDIEDLGYTEHLTKLVKSTVQNTVDALTFER